MLKLEQEKLRRKWREMQHKDVRAQNQKPRAKNQNKIKFKFNIKQKPNKITFI